LKLLGKTKTISSQLLIEIGWQSKITNTSFVAAFVEEQMFAKKNTLISNQALFITVWACNSPWILNLPFFSPGYQYI